MNQQKKQAVERHSHDHHTYLGLSDADYKNNNLYDVKQDMLQHICGEEEIIWIRWFETYLNKMCRSKKNQWPNLNLVDEFKMAKNTEN